MSGKESRPLRVLVVDDSRFIRELMAGILEAEGIRVVGQAADGNEAIQQVEKLNPDLVTMDIEMPNLDGLAAIEAIMLEHPVPIMVVTSRGDAHTAFAAMARGALDILEKPQLDGAGQAAFVDRVKSLAQARVTRKLVSKPCAKSTRSKPVSTSSTPRSLVAIASSTGGPEALRHLLSELHDLREPVVIAQHVVEGFCDGMAQWLTSQTGFPVRVARHGDLLQTGLAYLAPPEYSMTVTTLGGIKLGPPPPEVSYHPSCDALLTSAARSYGRYATGIVLTGMGRDGVAGLGEVKRAGGMTIAQDEATSLIFGMPRAAIDSGCVDQVLPLGQIPKVLLGKRP